RHPADCVAVDALQCSPQLADDHVGGRARLPLVEGLAHAQDRGHVVADDRLEPLVDGLVGLAEMLAALRVADDHVGNRELGQHRSRDLAGVGTFVLPEHVLGSETDPHPVDLDHRLRRPQRREGRGHHHLHPLVVVGLEAAVEHLDHLQRLHIVAVHLPVAADQVLPITHFDHLPSTATPGSSWPSNSSRPAPPPVDRCDTESSLPKSRNAEAESPPPTAVNPLQSAIAAATASVPARKRSHSKTPIGPFQKTDWAPRITSPNAAAASGPMSSPIVPAGMASAGTTREGAFSAKASATTMSEGSSMRSP